MFEEKQTKWNRLAFSNRDLKNKTIRKIKNNNNEIHKKSKFVNVTEPVLNQSKHNLRSNKVNRSHFTFFYRKFIKLILHYIKKGKLESI